MILSYKVFGKDGNAKEVRTDLAKPNREKCQAS